MSQAGLVNATGVPLLPTDFVEDSGAATPAGNILNINGASGISTLGVGNSVTITGQPIFVKKVTLSSADVKALHGTPITAISAVGANKAIVVLGASSQLFYAGTNVFTAAACQTIELYYGTTASIDEAGSSLVSNAMITSAAHKFTILGSKVNFLDNQALGVVDNVDVTLYNPNVAEIGGNAGNDNYIIVSIAYFIAELSPPT